MEKLVSLGNLFYVNCMTCSSQMMFEYLVSVSEIKYLWLLQLLSIAILLILLFEGKVVYQFMCTDLGSKEMTMYIVDLSK